jgi:uncharacterized membrane protein
MTSPDRIESRSPGGSPEFLIVIAALLAMTAKLYCAARTIGTNDAEYFFLFAASIDHIGPLAMYGASPLYNHTPLIGEMLVSLLHVAQATHSSFFFWLRLPGILADFLSVFALLWLRARTGKPPWWALAIFAMSPVSFMVSGFHGNVDSLLVFFLLLAACTVVDGNPWAGGIFLGLACNVKVVPIILVPIFLSHWWHRRRLWPFAISLAAAIALGWGPGLWFTPGPFVHNVLSYSGYWGEWGITSGLYSTGIAAFQPLGFMGLTTAERLIILLLKTLIIGGVLLLAWRKREGAPANIFSTLTLAWMLFFVFAPGSAPQYLVWFAPFLLVHSPRWYAVVTAACTVFLLRFYTVICHGFPWNLGRSTLDLVPIIRPWTTLPWIAMAILLAASCREIFASPRSETDGQMRC